MYIWIPLAIIFACIGAWPIGIGITALGLYFTISKKKAKEREENEKLKEENQKLRQELQEQAIRHAMDKTEKRKEKTEK